MKEVTLNDVHIALGAKMVDFAGFNMPLQYSGLKDEHITVRESVGVFDVSHMGEFMIEGEGAKDLLQRVCSNDIEKIEPGKAQYSCLPNETGGIVDDLLVYMIADNKYMLVVNASNIEKDWNWIKKHNEYGAEMKNISEETSLLAVQGPKATEVLKGLTEIDLDAIPFYQFKTGKFADCDDVIISATGYTGSGGFEIYFKNDDAKHIWDAVMEAGKEYEIKPAGLGARDTLRLEMGFGLYGNDLDDSTSPLEARLGWATKFTKDFVNSEALKKQKEEGVKKKLVGFEMRERGIPRKDYDILNEQEEIIGRVTSGTMSPSLNKAIGLGYVPKEYSKIGNEIWIAVRKKKLKAEVVSLPFYKNK